jgi:hypothetical protein
LPPEAVLTHERRPRRPPHTVRRPDRPGKLHGRMKDRCRHLLDPPCPPGACARCATSRAGLPDAAAGVHEPRGLADTPRKRVWIGKSSAESRFC